MRPPCRYCPAAGMVEWWHPDVDEQTHTCYHHARSEGERMVVAGWARVTEEEWWGEELLHALPALSTDPATH